MNSCQSTNTISRRTSERNRLKMLARNHQYKIANPYRQHLPKDFPIGVINQVRKIPFLSFSTISHLSFSPNLSETDLLYIIEAQRIQQNKVKDILCINDQNGWPALGEVNSLTEDMNHKANIFKGAEIVQTRQQIPISIYEPKQPINQNIFQYVSGINLHEDDLNPEQNKNQPVLESSQLEIQNQYKKYFID